MKRKKVSFYMDLGGIQHGENIAKECIIERKELKADGCYIEIFELVLVLRRNVFDKVTLQLRRIERLVYFI